MSKKTKRKIKSFQDLILAKEQVKLEIIKNEYTIRDSHKDIISSLTPVNILNSLIETVVAKPNIAIKAGYIIGSFIKARSKKKKIKN